MSVIDLQIYYYARKRANGLMEGAIVCVTVVREVITVATKLEKYELV